MELNEGTLVDEEKDQACHPAEYIAQQTRDILFHSGLCHWFDGVTALAPPCAAPQLGQNPALSATIAPHFVQCGIAPPRNYTRCREANKIPFAQQEKICLSSANFGEE